MIPWIGVDLEPGVEIARTLPDLDLLDIAYSATHGGANAFLLPASEATRSSRHSADLFDRPGLPLLTIKAGIDELDRLAVIGSAPDRILLTGERGQPLRDPSRVAEMKSIAAGGAQELAVVVDAEANAIKELSRLKVQWVFFRTDEVYLASSTQAAEADLAKLTSAALIAHKLNLRVALWGSDRTSFGFGFCCCASC